MPANPVHHTATTDATWDASAEEARLASPVTKATGNAMYAWHDPAGADHDHDGYPDAKADSKFAHHMTDGEGNVGDANQGACSSAIGYLNRDKSSASYPNIPDRDRQGVWDHLAAHLRDANKDQPDYEPPGLRGIGGAFEERAAFTGARIELRVAAEGRMPMIVGHAAVYSQWSQDLGPDVVDY